MKFGNAAWGFRETPLREQLEITRNMGLSLLEVGIANAPNDLSIDISSEETKTVKKLFENYNIKPLCAATGNDFTTGGRQDVQKIKKVIDICNMLETEFLRIFAGFSPVDEVVGGRWNTMIECLIEVGKYAAEKGVTLAIETHGGVNSYNDGVLHFHSVTTKPEVLYKLMGELPAAVKLNFDPANFYAVGIKNPEAIYEKIKDRIAYAHFKDFITLPSGNLKPAACGEGDMDWKAILKAMAGFDRPVLFEYENTEDVQEGYKRCYDYIANIKREKGK